MASTRPPQHENAALVFDGLALERASTAEQVAAMIRRQLLKGEVAPGTKLSDQAIAAGLAVSRHAVREAMLILESEGLVQRSLHKGAVVAELGIEELTDVYQARRALELSGLHFAARAGEAWVEELRAALAAMEAAAAAADTQELLDADRKFHEVIIAPIGSRRLLRFHRLVQTEIRLTRVFYGGQIAPAVFVARHAEIVEAVGGGNFELGSELLELLIDDGEARQQQQLLASDRS